MGKSTALESEFMCLPKPEMAPFFRLGLFFGSFYINSII